VVVFASHAVGRYDLYDEIAVGGMATVYYGRLRRSVGFSRTVAIKRLHPQYARAPEFVSMFLDEARLAARIRHPNVVQTLDVVALEGELLLVLEYVHGESLAGVLKAAQAERALPPLDVTSAVVCGLLHGLHAAHEATDDHGTPLQIVHRDVSPQNVLLGADGEVRVLDFGVAKAAGRVHTTKDGNIKGKLGYMSPEQLSAQRLDRRADVFAAGIVLWEMLTGERLFAGESEGAVLKRVLDGEIDPPSRVAAGVPKAVDGVTLKALERVPSKRFPTAREMAVALEACVPVASPRRVGAWVETVAGELLARRAETVARIEESGRNRDAEPSQLEPTESAAASSVPTVLEQRRLTRQPDGAPRAWGRYVALGLLAGGAGLAVARFGSGNRLPVTSLDAAPPLPSAAPLLEVAPSESPPPPLPLARTSPSPPRARPASAPPHPKACVPAFVDDAGIKRYRACP
jgi:serine/threonine-protein kinase